MVGFVVCIPVGPIAILILRRTIADGRLAGFISGLGAAVADALLGVCAVLFLSALTPLLHKYHAIIQIAGGIFIIAMGIFILRTPPKIKEAKRPVHERNLIIAFFSTIVLTMSNPITLTSMTGIAAAAGMGSPDTTRVDATMLVAGIFTASTLWWVFICTCAHWLARKLGHGFLRAINLTAAMLIIVFGAYLILQQGYEKSPIKKRIEQRKAAGALPQPQETP